MAVNSKRVVQGVRILLRGMGQDLKREGLRETPGRHARFLSEWMDMAEPVLTTFDSEGMSEMVVQDHIPFYSLCEHHLLPFFGMAVVGYVPSRRIVGLSKLARAVQYCARGPQNQERVTQAVADMLESHINPEGVGVVLRARHLCMEMRGVKAPGAESTTSCLRGSFMEDTRCRAEFLAFAKDGFK